MIFSLKGTLIAKNGLQVIVDVAGVGYGVSISMNTFLNLPQIGEELFLFTHLSIREDHQILYGFLSEGEKFLFCELIKISGLGGKIALTILSHLNVEQFLEVVQSQDLVKLTNIPGIGKKIAQRLILEMQSNLKNKNFKEFIYKNNFNDKITISAEKVIDEAVINDVQEALVVLGYKSKQALLAIQSVINQEDPIINISSEKLLKATLKNLSKVYYD